MITEIRIPYARFDEVYLWVWDRFGADIKPRKSGGLWSPQFSFYVDTKGEDHRLVCILKVRGIRLATEVRLRWSE